MNNEPHSQSDSENAHAFDRLRDRRRAKRRRVLRVVLTLLVCAALLGVPLVLKRYSMIASGRRGLLCTPADRKALSRYAGHERQDRCTLRAGGHCL